MVRFRQLSPIGIQPVLIGTVELAINGAPVPSEYDLHWRVETRDTFFPSDSYAWFRVGLSTQDSA